MSSADVIEDEEPNAWWTTLKHEGVLLSPPVLEDVFPDGPPVIREQEIDTLRRDYRDFRNDPDELRDWLDTVFEDLMGHTSRWEKEHLVSDAYTHQDLRPNRVLFDDDGDPRFAVWIDDDRVTTDDGDPGRIGIYSGRRTHADLVKLLRNTDIPLGILTNGHQFRVVHATLDRESWTEWDARAWFEGGEGRDTLAGFYGLLSDEVLPDPAAEGDESLLDRVQESRERQADLSDVMGTQVREAVEMLLQELDSILMEVDPETREEILEPLKGRDLNRQEELRARYQASIRIIMRLVVALYAESRELFPKENPVYYDSYSVEGLFRELREAKIEDSEEALEKQYGAWPRLQSLSRLIYYGSSHPDIAMQSYGGRLFRPPSEDGEDDVLAGIEIFEHDEVRITDATILEILEKLKIAQFQAGGSRRRGPVDFSELRTEYIGMMYEGLLDYDLREATEDDGAIIFLSIGDEPALPFNVLENLDDDGLDNLVDNLKDESSGSFLADDEVSEEDFNEDELEAVEGSVEAAEDQAEEPIQDIEARVHHWAKRVVEETGVYMPHHNTVRAMDPTIRKKYEAKAARRLVERIIRPGGTYLVSWEGTRKSTGTFYTPPGLAIPTVHRTLQSKVYDETTDGELIPKRPKEIVDLKICDPAMGSGTFPVAAVRYLTEVLKDSFEKYVLSEIDEGEPVAAPLGERAEGVLTERLLSIRKGEDGQWEDRLKVQLKRVIVERCIYGVDINPLAVELGKLSLWIETMNPDLPFTFLDHKLRVGNSLIGAWLHQFQHYPVAAWNREGGDGRTGDRTKRIRDFRNNEMKSQMETYIQNAQHQTHWFESGPDVADLLEEAKESFEELHKSATEDQRERVYREEFRQKKEIQHLRHLMDRWCAVWFWPMDSDDAPVLDPKTFYNTESDNTTRSIVENITDRKKLNFFHWELEFPDVFVDGAAGFDAIIGNPPWEIEKPQESEFFSRYRPEFHTYGKQESKRIKKQLFNDQPSIRRKWHKYREYYRGFSNYVKHSTNPWDVPLARGNKKEKLADEWRAIRNRNSPGILPDDVPYQHQGSADLNTFKLFAERFHFLTNSSGRLGILTPDGLYLGDGTSELRKLFLNRSSWEWLYSFHNKNKIFDIPSQDKFAVSVIDKSGVTDSIRCNFLQTDLDPWTSNSPPYFETSRKQINRFSPENNVILETISDRDIEILDKLYEDSTIVSDDEEIQYVREYDTGTDSGNFNWTYKLEDNGFKKIGPKVWENSEGERAVPLVQGAAVHQFDFPHQVYKKGAGWSKMAYTEKMLRTKYLVFEEDHQESNKTINDIKIAYRRTTQPVINPRSMIASLIPDLPTADSVFILKSEKSGISTLALTGILNSYLFDYSIRFRIPGINLSKFIIQEAPIPELSYQQEYELAKLVAKLNWHPEIFPDISKYTDGEIKNISYETDEHGRAQLREQIDALVSQAYGISDEEMRWILRSSSSDPRSLRSDYEQRLEMIEEEGRWE